MCCYVLFIEFFPFSMGYSFVRSVNDEHEDESRHNKRIKRIAKVLKTAIIQDDSMESFFLFLFDSFEIMFFFSFFGFLTIQHQFLKKGNFVISLAMEHEWNFYWGKARFVCLQLFPSPQNWLTSKQMNRLITSKCVLKAIVNFILIPWAVSWAVIKWMNEGKRDQHPQHSELFIYLWILQTGNVIGQILSSNANKDLW